MKLVSGRALAGAVTGGVAAVVALALDPRLAAWSVRLGALALVATGWLSGVVLAWRAQERADVDYILRLREELRRSQDHIIDNATFQSLGAYLEIAAHQMRGPLDDLRSRTTALAEDPSVPDPFRLKAAALRESVEKLHGMLRHLAVFRLGRPGRAPFSVNNLLQESVLLCRHRAQEKGIRFQVSYAEIPPVFGPAGRVQSALGALLVNAIEAMPHGGGTVSIETAHEGDRVVARIRDTGIGIRPEHLPKVFDPFFTTKPDGAGSGLGLWAARQSLDLIGGDISIRSAPFKGTEVTVLFPQAAPVRPGRAESVFPEELPRNTAEDVGPRAGPRARAAPAHERPVRVERST